VADLQQVVDVLVGGAFAHQRDDAELEDLPRLGDLHVGQSRQAQQVDDTFAETRASRRRHEGAPARADLDGDHPVGLEPAQRLAHRHPAYPEPFAEFPLGGQPVTRPQLTVANQEPDLVNDHL
jgi:hypothetical protein